MKITHMTDYFAPLGSHTRVIDLRTFQEFMPLVSLRPHVSPQSMSGAMVQLDSADGFTYIIMGLAVFISILIPVLNWS